MSDHPRPDPPSPDGHVRGNRHSLAAELTATAHRVEHAVEERLEHGIEVAEQTIARRFGLGALRAVRTTLRFAFWSLVAAYFAFDLGRFLSLDYFKAQQAAIDAYFRANPLQSAAIYFAIYLAVTGLSLPGAAILTLAGGAIFGLLWARCSLPYRSWFTGYNRRCQS